MQIIEANANDIPFEDDTFDVVLSNATLEHDPFFWKSAHEMRRILAPGGVLMIGVPGFAESKAESLVHRVAARLPWIVRHANPLASATLTFKVHYEEGRFGDYYRFSRMAVEEVLFAGMEILALETCDEPAEVRRCGPQAGAARLAEQWLSVRPGSVTGGAQACCAWRLSCSRARAPWSGRCSSSAAAAPARRRSARFWAPIRSSPI